MEGYLERMSSNSIDSQPMNMEQEKGLFVEGEEDP
jgi:hypothetical protein